jgi:hypothetical protein
MSVARASEALGKRCVKCLNNNEPVKNEQFHISTRERESVCVRVCVCGVCVCMCVCVCVGT